MSPLLPPSEYINNLVNDIQKNIVADYSTVSNRLTEKVLGFRVKHFGEVEFSEYAVENIREKIDPELLKNTEEKIVKQVEANLEKVFTKAFINRLTADLQYKVYESLEKQIYERVNEYITKRIDEQVIPELDKYFSTWEVAAKLVDAHEKK